MTRPADSWASAMSTTARPLGSHAYKPCGSSTVTAPPRVHTHQHALEQRHSHPGPRKRALKGRGAVSICGSAARARPAPTGPAAENTEGPHLERYGPSVTG